MPSESETVRPSVLSSSGVKYTIYKLIPLSACICAYMIQLPLDLSQMLPISAFLTCITTSKETKLAMSLRMRTDQGMQSSDSV